MDILELQTSLCEIREKLKKCVDNSEHNVTAIDVLDGRLENISYKFTCVAGRTFNFAIQYFGFTTYAYQEVYITRPTGEDVEKSLDFMIEKLKTNLQ